MGTLADHFWMVISTRWVEPMIRKPNQCKEKIKSGWWQECLASIPRSNTAWPLEGSMAVINDQQDSNGVCTYELSVFWGWATLGRLDLSRHHLSLWRTYCVMAIEGKDTQADDIAIM